MEILLRSVTGIVPGQAVMWLLGGALIYLAIARRMEPTLLLPMGFGAILMHLPAAEGGGVQQVLETLFDIGIAGAELFPLLLFIGIGAMIDFGPLLADPKLMLFGAAAQFGIFFTLGLASALGFRLPDAASIAIIGAADGPTSIFVATQLGSRYLGAIMVAAYSYMALVPIVQPPIIRLLTTPAERRIRMKPPGRPVSPLSRILFPIGVTVIVGIAAPEAAALIGFLMFGNLLRECGVLLAKFLNLFLKEKLNPMIGAAGISAFPMSARVVHKIGQQEDHQNFLLMHAGGVNVSGQIASVIAGGLILSLVKAAL